jgi:glycine cleavage system regulatory protein
MKYVSIVLTVIADDQPGIVEDISDALATHGGNWTESSMMSLAGKFAGILLAEVPEDRADSFLRVLDSLEAGGMEIVAQRSDAPARPEHGRDFTIDLVGQDHPGIVHDITEVLAGLNINVQELETTVQSASMSGESLFLAHARIHVPEDVSPERLQQAMEALANELMVDITLEK